MIECPKCGYQPKITSFLGHPVRMWWEISCWLSENGTPGESPLGILSRLVERKEVEDFRAGRSAGG